MNATMESTAPYQSALDRTVPSPWAGQLRSDLNELQMYRAQQPVPDPVKTAAKKARADNAREDKTRRLKAAMDAVISLYRKQLVDWTGTAGERAIWVQKQIQAEADAEYAALVELNCILTESHPEHRIKVKAGNQTLVPGWRYIDDYLKSLHI
ncbi:hypothetical protein NVV94_05665 [Pseudomonas sp. LS1212]|uniref:hypothetical protein n=1 Tax=Pseudomonas sp. LS1212 TaxID=2972478 RepID=UPI00215D3386|nr:hypothetical protein [Pseudomonas sp. LS1212]UVJ45069.1 hypothetical protein NVV94_05665 [Pseudomonas sp. LS1212]